MSSKDRYAAIIEAIFEGEHARGERRILFDWSDVSAKAKRLNVEVPRNLDDVIYSFRYRRSLPDSILKSAPDGKTWIITSAGRGRYAFVLVVDYPISPNPNLAVTKIPDATPGIIAKYAFSNESALLTQVRHNRLIDVFLGITCYSLQNHLWTTVSGVGQVETDEVYIGIDRFGSHYVIPVQAEVGNNSLSRSKIEQAIAVCSVRLPNLICRAVGVHLTAGKEIALFEFEQNGDDISIVSENHYLLVPPDEITNQDLIDYRQRLAGRT